MKYPKEYLDEIKLRLKVSQVINRIWRGSKNTSSRSWNAAL